SPEELDEHLPAKLRRQIAEKELNFYIINAAKIASEIGLGGRINMVTQAAFFKLTEIIPVDDAVKYLKESVVTSYGKKGQNIVDMNNAAIDQGVGALVKVDVPASWKDAVDDGNHAVKPGCESCPSFVQNIAQPINAQAGYDLPVSKFSGYEDGTLPAGTAKFEKRGPALFVPKWLPENCIQCNQCSFVCPHATIRPILATEAEVAAAPDHFDTIPALGAKDLQFRIAVSPLDCLGCGNCVDICPAPKGKAIVMTSIDTEIEQAEAWNYGVNLPVKENPMKKETVKGSQFEQPLFEFSGACAGCGETPYAKLLTQLFGDRMMIANATGCSSIWGASMPASPYTTNQQGHGPSWANSLFEDNAEYGYGMYIGVKKIRQQLVELAAKAVETATGELKDALEQWIEFANLGAATRQRSERLVAAIEAEGATTPELKEILEKKQFLIKRSHWIFGGDGWAYDIGFGGVDHVLASGEDVNIFVFDTEVYSNTGGQASKSTNVAAVAQFAASGKRTKKKDLGMMAMSYGYVYVAQVAMGADKNQLMKAVTEAEAYPGPSLIIAYSPCINHGIKAGMGKAQEEQRKAVAAGYWDLYRYNPQLKEEGKNPFSLDSKEPTESFQDFLKGEVRYASLAKAAPDVAEELFAKTEKDAKERRLSYVRLQKGFEDVK
ncbi:pyruvate:ferredoxin (flavodoxin) oxidoreductase, partial [Veillonella sp.]